MSRSPKLHYWFSQGQADFADQLLARLTLVKVGDSWERYTEVTDTRKPSGGWKDYKLVTKGRNLETQHIERGI